MQSKIKKFKANIVLKKLDQKKLNLALVGAVATIFMLQTSNWLPVETYRG